MRRFNCGLLVSLIVVAISVLTAWSVQSTELRMVSSPMQAAVRSPGPESASAAVVANHPLANAGADQTTSVGATVLLDGSQSNDVAGDGLTFKWSFVSVPAGSTAKLVNPAAVASTFLIDRAGDYVVQLVVNDGTSSSVPDTVVISTANSRPVANAGANRTVSVGAEVTLDGSGSSDVDGGPLSFSWSFVSAPVGSGTVLANPSSIRPSFHVAVAGLYVVQLVVNDGRRSGVPSTVTVTTVNSAPVAKTGPDQPAAVGQSVQLDGSGSSDVDGDPLSFRWSVISRPDRSVATLFNSNTVNPSFTTDVAGSYVVQLVVNDGHANSMPETVTITTGNTRPVANAGPHQTVSVGSANAIQGSGVGQANGSGSRSAVARSVVQLDGSRSSDVDGDLLTFTWSFVSRPAGSAVALSNTHAVKPTFVPDTRGTYVIQLIVNDGTTDSAPVTVVISTENTAPVAKAGPVQTMSVGGTVQLDGAGSFDADSDDLTFSWSFVAKPDGSTAGLINPSGVRPMFVADMAGTYVVQLVVNDAALSSAPDTVTISTTNSRPVASAGATQTVISGRMVRLDGSASTDADHEPLKLRWSMTSQPPGSAVVLSNSNGVSPTFVADVPGVGSIEV